MSRIKTDASPKSVITGTDTGLKLGAGGAKSLADPVSPRFLSSKSLLNAPSMAMNSGVETRIRNTYYTRPFGECVGLTVKFISDVPAGIVRLLSWRCPFAIRRLVVTVWVNAFNRVSFRPSTHIVKERGKVVTPFVANGNTSRSVNPITYSVRIVAPSKHSKPDFIFWKLRKTVCRSSFGGLLHLVATARFAVTRCESLSRSNAYVPTIANAFPVMNGAATILLSVGMFSDCPTAKALTGNVNKFAHSFLTKAAHIVCVWQRGVSAAFSGATLARQTAYTTIEAKI